MLVGHCLAASPRIARGALAMIFIAAVLVGDDYQEELENGIDYLTRYDYINYFPYYLDQAVPADARVALTEAGRMGYWVKGEKLDLVGLNSADVARDRISVSRLEAFAPDMIFIHLAGALTDRIDTKADYLEISVEDMMVSDAFAEASSWRSVGNGVHRAPLAVLAFLKRHRTSYRLALVRYSGEMTHLYAIRNGGNVRWGEFVAMLEQSRDPAYAYSYQWFHDHPNAALRQRLGIATER